MRAASARPRPPACWSMPRAPGSDEVAETVLRQPLKTPARLIKGSHIVVRRRFQHECAYLLQAADGRIVFVLPFGDDFTLIGTTDADLRRRSHLADAGAERE